MCGIGGFSLSSQSKINARKLAKALLAELELRGNQASGYAWSRQRENGIYKKDITGSKLSVFGIPKRATNVILHTRMATHGTIRNMANNHPVTSPNKNIALVHNGVIWNHHIVRKHVLQELPEVDTAVIPAVLEQNGLTGLEMIEGDAAIAWLDEREPNKLKVARVSHSPLTIGMLHDGSMVFASTETILVKALKKLKLEAEWMTDVKEYTAITVQNGVITDWETIPETNPEFETPASKYTYYDYRSVTSGKSMMSKWDGYDYKENTKPWTIDDIIWTYAVDVATLNQGWNLIDEDWWLLKDGEAIIDMEEATHNKPMRRDYEYDEDDPDLIKDFKDYLAYFTLDETTGWYYDKDGAIVGDEDDLYEEYETWRYEMHWKKRPAWDDVF